MSNILEMRFKGLYRQMKAQFSNVPTYVFNEYYNSRQDKEMDEDEITYLKMLNGMNWKLQVLELAPKDFDLYTRERFKNRNFGAINPDWVPRDAERMAIQKNIVKGDGNNEPVLLLKWPDGPGYDGFELVEGWHRTMNLLLLGKNGDDVSKWYPVKIKAWVGYGE